MTDEELIARLRESQSYEWQDPIWGTRLAAADRIEALTKERDEADDLAKAAFADGASNNIRLAETAHRIEALTKEREQWRRAAETRAEGWKISDDARIEAEIKLAKAMETLRQIADPISLAQGNVNAEIARATLEEIKGESQDGMG
jgi:hypothetical protein